VTPDEEECVREALEDCPLDAIRMAESTATVVTR